MLSYLLLTALLGSPLAVVSLATPRRNSPYRPSDHYQQARWRALPRRGPSRRQSRPTRPPAVDDPYPSYGPDSYQREPDMREYDDGHHRSGRGRDFTYQPPRVDYQNQRRFDDRGNRPRPPRRPAQPRQGRRDGPSSYRQSDESFFDHCATIEDLWRRTNAERRRAGLGDLDFSAELSGAAQRHADDMALNDYISHAGMDGSTLGDRVRRWSPDYRYSALGENLYTISPYNSPGEAVSGWMESMAHRENLLRPSFADVGLGYAVLNGRHYYVQVFGRLPPEGGPAPEMRSTPGMILDLTNRVRSRGNLPPLEMNGALLRAAQVHAERMADCGGMISGDELLAESGEFFGFGRTAVNCASCSGPFNDPSSAVEGWLENSGETVTNLLEGSFSQAGVGYARRGDEHYYVQLLGSLARDCF